MSTTLALAANAQAAAAATRAAAAERIACLANMRGYVHDSATETAIRAYAACAEQLYPSAMSGTTLFAIKLSVAVLLIGAVGGAIFGGIRHARTFGWEVDGVLLGGIAGFLAASVACVSGWAVWFLLSYPANT